jgi:NaMN:DMB phosphoribosyltransferase
MTGRRTAHRRAAAVVAATALLLVAGSGSAWAWWVATTSATVSGAAPALAAPTGTSAACTPRFNFQGDPVVVSWAAVPVPAGASQVRYRVLFVSEAGVSRYFPSATTETTATSLSVSATQLGTNAADRVLPQTITVQAVAVYSTGTLLSGPSAAVAAHGESILGVVDMHC